MGQHCCVSSTGLVTLWWHMLTIYFYTVVTPLSPFSSKAILWMMSQFEMGRFRERGLLHQGKYANQNLATSSTNDLSARQPSNTSLAIYDHRSQKILRSWRVGKSKHMIYLIPLADRGWERRHASLHCRHLDQITCFMHVSYHVWLTTALQRVWSAGWKTTRMQVKSASERCVLFCFRGSCFQEVSCSLLILCLHHRILCR